MATQLSHQLGPVGTNPCGVIQIALPTTTIKNPILITVLRRPSAE